jgi:hypothetical protein
MRRALCIEGTVFRQEIERDSMNETEMNWTDEMHNHEREITTATARIPSMDDDLFARELDYQASMSIADGLLRRGLMTTGEVHKAKILLLQKYRPPISELLAEAG